MKYGGTARRAQHTILGTLIFVGTLLVPTLAHAATLFISPSSGHYAVGQNITVTIRVNSQGQPVNAIEGTLSFNPGVLHVQSITTPGSIFNLNVQEPDFSNTSGTARFAGVILNPGFTGASGNLLTISLKVVGEGTGTLSFASAAVLANDGHGSNILTSMSGAIFNNGGPAPTASPTPSTQPGISAPVITSSTHPDPTKWYNNNDPLFAWEVPSNVTELRLVLSERPTTVPTVRYVPPVNQKALVDVADGVWYLRGLFKAGSGTGPIGTLRFNIDTQSPVPFTLTRLDTSDPTEPQPQMLFSTTDATSGIDHYELQIGSGAWVSISADTAGKPYVLPLQLPGTRTVTVEAVDRAGNITTANVVLTVAPIPAPEITDFSVEVTGDSPATVSGTGTPGTTILLYSADPETPIGQAEVDAQGHWQTTLSSLASGTYRIYAYARDSRGAMSLPSNEVTIKVNSAFFARIGRFLDRLLYGILSPFGLWFWLSLLFYILLLLMLWRLLAWLIWWLLFFLRRRRDEKIPDALVRLYRDIEAELLLLEKVEKNRPLYPEEKYLRGKLNQYHKTIKFLITDTHSRLAKKK